jgi:hypothetical protein
MCTRPMATLAVLTLAAGLSLGCWDDVFGPAAGVDIDVLLVNRDDAAIHILGPGESFGTSNRLLSYDTQRKLRVRHAGKGVEFRAGAQGTIYDKVVCTASDPEAARNSATPPRVIWTGFGLLCSGWNT